MKEIGRFGILAKDKFKIRGDIKKGLITTCINRFTKFGKTILDFLQIMIQLLMVNAKTGGIINNISALGIHHGSAKRAGNGIAGAGSGLMHV